MLERLIKNRIEKHMQENVSDLSKNQYGFVRGRSTIDAIIRVKEIIEEKHKRGLAVIVELEVAVSPDIKNTFNTIE